uniref:Uncharacterized protein n=1 Tax=Lessardia elongata TaxID=210733 RepID=A0A7S2QWF5_9DINO|mmetsp:Transcript_444/g.384  ORF Transcript_444/g.384 Transcript_444/m.384 type:complete len:145 (+) Transcript_444:2-436(+)
MKVFFFFFFFSNRTNKPLRSQGCCAAQPGMSSSVLAAILTALALLGIGAKLEVFRPLDRLHSFSFALRALEFEDNLLGGLSFLVEDRLSLTTEACLLLVVTALALSTQRCLARLVLGDLMRSVLSALAAIRVPGLGNVHHDEGR